MQIHITNKDALWSHAGTIVSMGSNFFMLPFLVYFLDPDMLGLWYVFMSIGTITSLFDFGFAVTFSRNITYCWSGASELKKEGVVFSDKTEPNYALMKEVLLSSRLTYAIISITALIILGTAGTVYVKYITHNTEGYEPIISWLIYAFAIFLNIYYGYYSSFLIGVGAVSQANKNIIYARGAHIILMIVLLFMGTGIIGASSAYLAYGAVFRLLGKYHFYKYENIGENLSRVTSKTSITKLKEVFIIVWHNAWRNGIIAICNYLCSQASVIICSLYMPLYDTGVYSIGVQIATAIANVSKALYGAKQPEIQNAYITSDMARIRSVMKQVVAVFIALFILGVICFITIGMPLLKLVKPDAVVSIPVFLGISVYNIMLGFRDCYASYFACTNRIIYLRAYIIAAVLGVILSFIMMGVFNMGVWGLIASQIISQGCYNVWYWPMKAIREMYE